MRITEAVDISLPDESKIHETQKERKLLTDAKKKINQIDIDKYLETGDKELLEEIIKKLENLYLNISLIAIDIGFFAFFKRDFDNLFFDEVAPTVIASTGEIDFIFKSALINPVHNSNIKAKMEQTLHNTVAIEREKPSIYSVVRNDGTSL